MAPQAEVGSAESDNKGHMTLVHALRHNAKHCPNHVLIQWVNSQCKVESSLTYQELWQQSATVATLLLKNGVKSGDRVMIAYPFGLEFLSGLFACMRIGVIPCSVSSRADSQVITRSFSHPSLSLEHFIRSTHPISWIGPRLASVLNSSTIK